MEQLSESSTFDASISITWHFNNIDPQLASDGVGAALLSWSENTTAASHYPCT